MGNDFPGRKKGRDNQDQEKAIWKTSRGGTADGLVALIGSAGGVFVLARTTLDFGLPQVDSAVRFQGETGTGKGSGLSDAIHEASPSGGKKDESFLWL